MIGSNVEFKNCQSYFPFDYNLQNEQLVIFFYFKIELSKNEDIVNYDSVTGKRNKRCPGRTSIDSYIFSSV